MIWPLAHGLGLGTNTDVGSPILPVDLKDFNEVAGHSGAVF